MLIFLKTLLRKSNTLEVEINDLIENIKQINLTKNKISIIIDFKNLLFKLFSDVIIQIILVDISHNHID